jgi:hypothetical protein
MENTRTIDRSFKERLGVLQLLERLKKENITYAEMDDIGNQLRKAGRSAVQPLLRKLWREKNGTLISKYTYLLDFLDERYWFDQIIQIALKRKDLELEGKSAILATLEDCGVDVTVPPFSVLLACSPGPLAESFPLLLNRGEEGVLWLLEDFAGMPLEMQRSFLEELATLADPRVLDFLRMLLWYDDEDVVAEVIAVLGRIRVPRAATLLEEFRPHAAEGIVPKIVQSLRRLSFVGINPEAAPPARPRQPFHSAYAGPLDGSGYRHLWLARWRDDGGIDSVDFQLHDQTGIKGVWGESGESAGAYEERAALRAVEELVEPIPPEYGLELLRDALYRNREQGYQLPPEFLLRRSLFTPEELEPEVYEPSFPSWPVVVTSRLLALSGQLFEDEFFAGWTLSCSRAYEAADEWVRLEENAAPEELAPGLERLVAEFCREEFQPRLGEISRRLFLNADYLARAGVDGELVKATLAAAESIRQFALPCHLHPFLRRYAMESLMAAREALAEGYDIRDNPEDDEWQ